MIGWCGNDLLTNYPAHLKIDYPEKLSRGLVLVKRWLLAIPHYIIVGILVGGGSWAGRNNDYWRHSWSSSGLIGILVLVAAVVLAATGTYARPLYSLILGLNRWVLRVGAYAGLMTDQYPPFRLDMGPHEPDSSAPLVQPTPGDDQPSAASAPTA